MRHINLQFEQASRDRRNLIRYASKIIGDRDHAEDVVQEAYVRLGEATGKRLLAEPRRYLVRIVRNLALDTVWRSQREGAAFMPDGDNMLVGLPAGDPSPEEEALARDDVRRLATALAELPVRTRVAVEMHRFGGAKLREIADELGVSITVAHQLVTEGVAHCRERLR